jgi:hypothetical protein
MSLQGWLLPVRFLGLNNCRRRNLPFVYLPFDRPLYLQQQLLNSDGLHDVPRDCCPLEPIGYIPSTEAEANYFRHLANQAATPAWLKPTGLHDSRGDSAFVHIYPLRRIKLST